MSYRRRAAHTAGVTIIFLAVGWVVWPASGDSDFGRHQPAPPDDGKLRIIAFGAHPDDMEYDVGATAAKWAALGHHVKLVSVTNGDIGHWREAGGTLAKRRAAEVQKVAEGLGTYVEVLDIHDGELEPTLENRRKITRLIREWKADVVFSHRPNDYHPDHRYVGVLVQDAAFMVAVPFFCPDTPPLKSNPLFLFTADRFQKPNPFTPDIAIDVGDVFEQKVRAISAMESQIHEGGALGSAERMAQISRETGDTPEGKIEYVRKRWDRVHRGMADRYRDVLAKWYGAERAAKIEYADAFEICEYGRQPSDDEIRKLFPFLPKKP